MKLILAILLGALVGLRNEIVYVKKGRGPLGGFRSYIFIGILGYLSGMLVNSVLGVGLANILHLAIVGIVLIYYFYDMRRHSKLGLTMELSALIVYVASFAITTSVIPSKIAVAIVILVAFLLASQKSLRNFLFAFKETEVTQIALFATLTFVILPFLPDKTYSLFDLSHMISGLDTIFLQLANNSVFWQKVLFIGLINPFKLWLFVVLVSGIEVLGYIVSRLVGKTTSLLITGLVSGFISSTSSTIAFSREAKASKNKALYLAVILLANAISFVEVYLLVAPVSLEFFQIIFKANTALLLILGVIGVIVLQYAKRLENKTSKTRAKLDDYHKQELRDKMFDIKFALGFAVLLTVVQIITKIAYVLLGNAGFLITSALAGFSGINAVLINTGMLVQNHMISPYIAGLTFLVVNIVNLLAKSVYILINKQKTIAIWYTLSVLFALSISALFLFI